MDRFGPFWDLFPYTLPYFIFLILVLILVIFKYYIKKKIIANILIIILFVIFGGLKKTFAWDLENYCGMYHEIKDQIPVFIEPFYIFSSEILSKISSDCIAIFI